MYPTNPHQIFTMGRTIDGNERSELRFTLAQGTLRLFGELRSSNLRVYEARLCRTNYWDESGNLHTPVISLLSPHGSSSIRAYCMDIGQPYSDSRVQTL